MAKPNVLIFLTDGHRADCVGCYGNQILQTPHIDALAGEGVRFTRSFSSHTVCMPTRASVFTGRYPHVHRVWANGVPLRKTEVTLPQVLAENGYRTCASGKIHFEPQQRRDYPPTLEPGQDYYGFQEVHRSENRIGAEYLRFIGDSFPQLAEAARRRGPMPEEAHELQWITSQAIDFIERSAGADQPFFCSCSFHELIPPCHPPTSFADMYRPEDMPPPRARDGELVSKPPYQRECYEAYVRLGRHPDEATLRKHLATYYSQASFIDKQFGRIAAKLKELDIWDDTIVLFTADHGLVLNDHFLWRHGPFLYEQVINVPMLWRVPGLPRIGQVIEGLVESVDIMPTILDLAGVESPTGVQGESLRPLLHGEPGAEGKESALIQDRESPELLARQIDPTGFKITALRTRDWKLVHYRGHPHGELYDLQNDPDEFENRWADREHRNTRTELERLLLERLLAAEDPLPERHYHW
ncbi:MAG: sulfatase-like hydrolase/transferase [Armatimonadota bacterium]|jgi:arylsulfatase A-like enzyme